jgi:Fungal Zn(2)-Cys(6) binuclear cluster domain/Fungal specific transcription factor domain
MIVQLRSGPLNNNSCSPHLQNLEMNSTESSVKRRRRQSGHRSTTGCLCCRLRHKKCDEINPTCGGCWRNSLICSWPQQGSSNSQVFTSLKRRRSLLSTSDDATVGIIFQKVPKIVAIERTSLKSRDTCESELQGETDFGSSRLNIGRQGFTVTPHLRSHNKWALSTNPGHLTLRDSNTRTLFAHYAAETAAPLCTRPDTENPFLAYVLPRAYADSLIMSAVIALSGVHFCHKIPNADMMCTTWSYYAQAI